MKAPYEAGAVVGNFTVIKCVTPKTATGVHRVYLARCNHCGSEKFYRSNVLVKQDGCGCTAREQARRRSTIHGHYYERLHRIWDGMHRRCECPNNSDYVSYGGRGIKVCQEWNDYETFYRWAISHGYKQSLSIDRKDVDGPYSPDNCRWVSNRVQAQNRRNSIRTKSGDSLRALADAGNVKEIRNFGLNLWAKAVKKKAGFVCELCGATADRAILDAHHWYATKAHIAPTDLMLSNGVCLCRTCHIKAHAEPAKYKAIITKKRGRSQIEILEHERHKRFDIKKALEAIQRCRKILKEQRSKY